MTPPFHGDAFSVDLPAGWEDMTVYALEDPSTGITMRVTVDPRFGDRDVPRWARETIDRLAREGSGTQLLRAGPDDEESSRQRYFAEHLVPLGEGQEVFHRQWFFADEGIGIIASIFASERARSTALADFERTALSLQAGRFAQRSGGQDGGWLTYEHFRIWAPAGWLDTTTYMLVDGDPTGFRPALVVSKPPASESPPSEVLEGIRSDLEDIDGLDEISQRLGEAPDGYPTVSVVYDRPYDDTARVRQCIHQILASPWSLHLSLTYSATVGETEEEELHGMLASATVLPVG